MRHKNRSPVKMSNNTRIYFGGAFGIVILTALLFLLPVDGRLLTGYIFGLLGIAALCGTLLWGANRKEGEYVTTAAFPLAAFHYLVLNILLSVVVIALKEFDVYALSAGWFFFIHLVVVGCFIWKMLAMDSGREIIEERGEEVRVKSSAWRTLSSEINNLYLRAESEAKTQIAPVKEAFRYADPMSCAELEEIEERISGRISALKGALQSQDKAEIGSLCSDLLLDIKQRNEMCKMFKNN